MASEGMVTLVWNLFEKNGGLGYYLMFRSLNNDELLKGEDDRRRERIERLTR